MASVTLKRGNDTLVVTTPRAFVDAVYNKGYVPQSGSVESAYEALVAGGTPSGQNLSFIYSTNGTIRDSIVLTAAAYAALPVKVATTQYIIIG